MSIQVLSRQLAVVLLVGSATITGSANAQAGFLDQLFGGGGFTPQTPAPQVAPSETTPLQGGLGYDPAPSSRHVKKKVAVVDKTPKLQKTTDLMSDKTLRYGDAVMMKSGLHIYTGLGSSHHDTDEFVALDDVRHLSKQERGELTSMDMAHRAPLDYVASNTVQEGRSAAGGPVISEGYRITDARGRSIRYVGP